MDTQFEYERQREELANPERELSREGDYERYMERLAEEQTKRSE